MSQIVSLDRKRQEKRSKDRKVMMQVLARIMDYEPHLRWRALMKIYDAGGITYDQLLKLKAYISKCVTQAIETD